VLAFCSHLRRAGIGALFLTHRPEALHLRLQQSGKALAWFLQGAGDPAKQTGRALPFFDAVAAGDDATAREVARRARHTWAQGDEYPEDFLFVEFFMQRSYLGAGEVECGRLLARYEECLEGAEDSRLPLCRALHERDARALDEALKAFLSERADDFEARAGSEPPESLATEALLSVEGLAVVRLAEQQGLSVAEDYLHVPSVARRGRAPASGLETWQQLEL
jgi:hypothetical protein